MAPAFFKECILKYFLPVHKNGLLGFFKMFSDILRCLRMILITFNVLILIQHFPLKETTSSFPLQCCKYETYNHYSLRTSAAGTCSRAEGFQEQLQILWIPISVIDCGDKKEEKGQRNKTPRQHENSCRNLQFFQLPLKY